MKKNFQLIASQKDEKLSLVLEKIYKNNYRTVIVLNKKKIIGVISEGDIIKALIYNKSLEITAEKLMNKSFIFLKDRDTKKAKKIFKKNLVGLIPIVDKSMELKDFFTLQELI